MIAAQLVADSSFHAFMIVAAVLFAAAAVMAIVDRSVTTALFCGGLAFAALAWIVVS